MEVTVAKYEDLDQVLTLQTQIYRVENLPPNAKEVLQNQWEKEGSDILVAKEKGTVLGTGTVYYISVAAHGRPYAFLEGFVVDESTRDKGVGSALFKKAIEVARHKNCYKVVFTSGAERTEAHKLYEKLGFKRWGVEFRMDL